MSRVHMLRALVNERLTAAVEDICGVFQRAIAEYEEEVSRSREEIKRQEKILDAILNPEIRLNRADPQQLFVYKDEVPPKQQESSPSLGQEETEPPHIKEEPEELTQGLEEAEVPTLTLLPLKSENNEEEQSSQYNPTQMENKEASRPTEQMTTEPDGEDCGVSEPASNLDLASDGQLLSSDCCETETEDSDDDDWKMTRKLQSGLNTLKSKKTQRGQGRLSVSNKFRKIMEPSKYHQQLFVRKEEIPPEQQEWSPSLGQEEPEPPHIKEEPEELSQGLEEAEFPTLPLLPLKSENNEEEQLSQFNPNQTENEEANTATEQMKTESDGEDFGVSEPASNLDPDSDLEPTSDGQPSCESETEDSDDDCKETRKPQSGLNTLKSKKTQRAEGQSLSVCKRFRRSMELSNELKPSRQIPSLVGCKVCGTSFPSKKSLMTHVTVHSKDCALCGKHFDCKESLKLHIQAHSTCNICSKKFCFISQLERHMQVHTRQKPFSCTICEKGFGRKDNLKQHMRLHTGEKPFSCSVCGKSYNRKENLQDHTRVHTGIKPFSCSVCCKCFDRKDNLHRHMRSHTGEKPFSCSICSKRFGHTGSLKIHMRIHTGEKPFNCSFCGKKFVQIGEMKTHMRIHTGEKPFSCSICSKNFGHRGSLTTHMRLHTGEKPYSCSVCGKCFSQPSHRKSHKCISENMNR